MTTTTKTIEAALKLVDSKKENLRKAFEDLQSNASSLSSFPLSWSDLDLHFSSIQSSLHHRFLLLQSLELQQNQQHQQPQEPSSSSNPTQTTTTTTTKTPLVLAKNNSNLKDPVSDSVVLGQKGSNLKDPVSDSVVLGQKGSNLKDPVANSGGSGVVLAEKEWTLGLARNGQVGSSLAVMGARPELRLFCERMDGKGLRKYIIERPKERNSMRLELVGALRCAPDALAMVLDAMEGFYGAGEKAKKGDKDVEQCGIRRTCVMLLEVVMDVVGREGVVRSDVKERAKNLAVEWKGKVSKNGENSLEALGFLQLLATYGLVPEFNAEEIVELLVIVSKYRQGAVLCRSLGLEDKVPDVVQRLINMSKQLLAVKFIFEFKLTERFPPVPLLKAYAKESKKVARKVRKKGNNSLQSLNEATAKEVSALKSVINHIENHNLESEYPKENLQKRIEILEKQKANRKRPAALKPNQPKQQRPKPQQQTGSKRQRINAPAASAPVLNSVAGVSIQTGSKRQQINAPAAPASVLNSVAGVNVAIPPPQQSHLPPAGLLPDHPAPYLGSSAGPYGLTGSTPPRAPYTATSAGLYGLAGAPMGFPGNPSPSGSHLYSSELHMPSGYYNRSAAYGGYGLPPQYHTTYYPK